MTDKTRRNLVMLRCNPQFCEAERHIHARQPALSEFETAVAALDWLARFESETVQALEVTNPGLAQVQ